MTHPPPPIVTHQEHVYKKCTCLESLTVFGKEAQFGDVGRKTLTNLNIVGTVRKLVPYLLQ